MHELILLRHAHAEKARAGEADDERNLSLTGEAEAEAAAAWLKRRGARPARVLCSPSARTRQTLERVLAALEFSDTRFEPAIYDATAGTLMSLLDSHSDAEQVLLVGHNPGIETLVALLATGQSGEFRGMPPAGIAWLELDGSLEPGAGSLKAFWSP
ncbi:SixA phosphatase family protein [Tahibacter amnicola]|uniref:Histidine phosphatase family protein n=1 Tax=Tahibacter amnicola TaxID=2976241 RepID=A0ABY6BIM4_9GAMM|nr:histidine phosphatase family protein [Tahibacter amnicola]UXI68471.1 histidine phosphatase family protein [Tahibacter amnicola]